MSPALLDSRAPAHTFYVLNEGHSLKNPNSEVGSASGLSKPRLNKMRKQTAPPHLSRSTPASETRNVDPGFNPFRPVPLPGVGSSISGEFNFGRVDDAAFVFGANRRDSSSNLNYGMGNSIGDVVLDDLRKLKIAGEKEYGSSSNPVFNSHISGIDESMVSKLPYEMRKLNIEGSGTIESSSNAKGVDSISNPKNKTHFSFAGGNVVSELPNELKKMYIKDSGEFDGGGLIYNADNMEGFAFGGTAVDSLGESSEFTLPSKMKNLNIEDSYNTGIGEEKHVNVNSNDKGSFAFGTSISNCGSLGGRTENMISDEIGKLKIGSRGEEASFGLNQKLEFTAKRDTRPKKKKGKLRKPVPSQLWFGQDFNSRENSSQEIPESSETYSPMDVSPYLEVLADNKYSRENSVTSEESFHLDENYVSGDTLPTVSHDTTDADLIDATQRLDISEADAKYTETKRQDSEYNFNRDGCAEGHTEESVSEAETESFKSATEHLDCISDTSAETEMSSSPNIRRQFCFSSSSEDTGRINFSFAASSSAQGQLSTATRQHKKKNRIKVAHDSYNSPNTKSTYPSSSMQFIPHSRTSLLLSPRKGQEDDASTILGRGRNKSNAIKELEINPEAILTPAASVAAQEACEKWRLRGNQAYANGDLSRAEDYYTQGVKCVSQSETSRGCLRALMLCYSNRAATRMSLGRIRAALGDCMMAAAIDPNFLKVQVRAANCYLALGEFEDASLHFKKCLQSGSDISVDQKLLVEASEGLLKAQKVSECMSRSADLLKRRTSTDAENALEIIAEALIISSHSEKLQEMKAVVLLMLGKYEEVIQLCEQTLRSVEIDSPASGADGHLAHLDGSDSQENSSFRLWRWRLIVKSYFHLGRLEDALAFLEKQVELEPVLKKFGSKSLEAAIPLVGTIRELLHHKAAGNEAFQSGRHAEAVEHYTAALLCNIQSRPFAAICFCNRAAAYQALGQTTDAIADCCLAIALDGNYLKAISRRATLFEMIRDYGQAAIDLQRLISLITKRAEKVNQSGASDRMTCVNDLKQAQSRLSVLEEEVKKEIPLNMYLILGVEPSVTVSEIKKAYKKAALRHHPDKAGQFLARSENGDAELWKEVAEEAHKDADRLFKMIGEAYAVLSDPTKRSRYDLEEEIRNNAQKRGSGSSMSRTHTDVQNYPFERSGNRRQWQEVWRSYGNS
ncbi:uncharacterized protein LOC132268238 isoform X2 [Cornus florida]|uniref:uncharacterized protein LOC132268238 isoform X2 n=1 Tax=Cornus florida TaxID=4283 RepID=UPI00289B5532|nr:uncharacterized protein LOC132268238 isoform X2 [Cornus florida]